MPHVNSSGGDDLASTDEVKVYKDEGEEEKRSSENLSEDKLGLVTESEEGKSSDIEGRSYSADDKGSTSGQDGKPPEPPGIDRRLGPLGYPIISPYPYHNGASMLGSKILPPPHPSALASLYMYNNEHFSQPPPAHMGIPPVNIDPKTGLPRPSMYGLPPTSQLSHPFCPPDFAQFTWGPPPGYPLAAFRSPYGPPLSSSPLPRFSPPGIMPPHPGFPSLQHPAIITPGPKQEVLPISSSDNNRKCRCVCWHCSTVVIWQCLSRHHPSQFQLLEGGGGLHGGSMTPPHMEEKEKKCKKPHIKKPLNAFMLFMKEMRAKVIEECTLKESAAINQILGRKWHALDRAEQSKYYDMARKEKELHMQLYPGWSARDNYALHSKKKKRKREPHAPDNRGAATAVDNVHWRAMENCSTEQKYKHDDICAQDCANAKKCRARFGLDQQNQWCKPCRRKKKCIRFLEDGGIVSNPEDDDDDDDDDDGNATSIATVDSTTEGESEIGSPMLPPSAMMFHMDENRNVQHSMVSQSHSPQPLVAPMHMRPHVKHSVENIVELRPPSSSQHHQVSLGVPREHTVPSSGDPSASRSEAVASSVSSTMVLAT